MSIEMLWLTGVAPAERRWKDSNTLREIPIWEVCDVDKDLALARTRVIVNTAKRELSPIEYNAFIDGVNLVTSSLLPHFQEKVSPVKKNGIDIMIDGLREKISPTQKRLARKVVKGIEIKAEDQYGAAVQTLSKSFGALVAAETLGFDIFNPLTKKLAKALKIETQTDVMVALNANSFLRVLDSNLEGLSREHGGISLKDKNIGNLDIWAKITSVLE